MGLPPAAGTGRQVREWRVTACSLGKCAWDRLNSSHLAQDYPCSTSLDNFLNLPVQKVLCYLIKVFSQACFIWLWLILLLSYWKWLSFLDGKMGDAWRKRQREIDELILPGLPIWIFKPSSWDQMLDKKILPRSSSVDQGFPIFSAFGLLTISLFCLKCFVAWMIYKYK